MPGTDEPNRNSWAGGQTEPTEQPDDDEPAEAVPSGDLTGPLVDALEEPADDEPDEQPG
jgi:hypothetical protein